MSRSPRGGVEAVCLDHPAHQQSMSQLDLEELAEIGTSVFFLLFPVSSPLIKTPVFGFRAHPHPV